MPRKESLIAAYILDGKGGGKKIGWDEVDQWSPEQGILWVHLNYTHKRSVQWLNKNSKLDKITVRSMVVDESRPRTVITPNGLLLFLRGVNLNPGQEPEDMVSIRVWADENRIITTRRRHLLSVDDLRNTIDTGLGPKTPAEFITMLNDRIINRMADVVDAIDEQVDSLEEKVVTEESYLLRPKISDIRRESIMIRRYLAPQREALNRLYIEDTHMLNEIDKRHIREATDRVIRYIEDLDSARERASITQEELMSRLSEQMNERMYILSVVAVLFLPLTFITGLLGINVGGIPGGTYKWGFLIVCIIMAALLAGTIWLLKRKKWM